MLDANGRTQDIERLRTLLDRLGSSDLTLAEAKGLRESVLGLVDERASTPTAARRDQARAFAGRNASTRASVRVRPR